MRRLLLIPALLLAGCSAPADDGGPTPAPTSPLPGPTLTVPGLGIEIDVEEFLMCLSDGGIDVEPEDAPRFDATTELRLRFDGEQVERVVEIFIYASSDDASAARDDVDAGSETPPQQVGNVLVTGLFEAVQDPAVAQNAGVVLGCLGNVDLSGG